MDSIKLNTTDMRRLLAHIIILTLAVLPVHVIAASVKNSNNKMSHALVSQVKHECHHYSEDNSQEDVLHSAMSCCGDSSYQCNNCSNCSQASGGISTLLLSTAPDKLFFFNTEKFLISHLLLNGVPQKNLLRPPRILV